MTTMDPRKAQRRVVALGSPDRAGGSRLVGPVRGAACWLAVAAGLFLVASMAAVASIAPYHLHIRGVYLTLVPLTAGYLAGVACVRRDRVFTGSVCVMSAVTLLFALVPTLRLDMPASRLWPAALAAAAVVAVFVRIGMWQAGEGAARAEGRLPLPAWVVAAIYALAWAWLGLAVWNPRETFPPTRWLLKATGMKITSAALEPVRVRIVGYRVSGLPPMHERGPVRAGIAVFTVGPLEPRPGGLTVTVSARRADGAPFQRPMWLTVDVDDPARPNALNDLEFYDTDIVDGSSAEAEALRRSRRARRFTTVASFALSQSLPAVRLRARLWRLDHERADGDLVFQPVAEADLGVWDLTPLARIRRQPVAGTAQRPDLETPGAS